MDTSAITDDHLTNGEANSILRGCEKNIFYNGTLQRQKTQKKSRDFPFFSPFFYNNNYISLYCKIYQLWLATMGEWYRDEYCCRKGMGLIPAHYFYFFSVKFYKMLLPRSLYSALFLYTNRHYSRYRLIPRYIIPDYWSPTFLENY